MAFPDDWPEDAKVGPKFLQELMRRFPDKVKVGKATDLAGAFEEFFALPEDDPTSQQGGGDGA